MSIHRSARARRARRLRSATAVAPLALAFASCASSGRPADPARRWAPAPLAPARELAPRPQDERADVPELPVLDESAGIDAYLAYALSTNPGLAAAEHRWTAARERVAQAGALPDPRLTYRYFVEEVETRVGPQEQAIGISQSIPWPGELGRREDVADAEAAAAGARYERDATRLAFEIADAYVERFDLGRTIEIVRGNRDLVRNLESVARARYRAGTSTHPDVVRAQVELGRLEDRLATLEERERASRARLNAALHRAPDAPLPWPSALPPPGAVPDEVELREELLAHNPELRVLRQEAIAARAGVELARTGLRPDFGVQLEYIDTGDARTPGVADSGQDPLIAGLSLTLPIQRGAHRAAVREAEARLVATHLEHDRALDTTTARAVGALVELRDAERRTELYRATLLPKAEESLASITTAYSSGDASFSDVIDAQRVLLEFELEQLHATTDRARHEARLRLLVGRAGASSEDPR